MITALLLRHYKNYGNVRFIPLMNDVDHMFTIFIGNNGVGKSAVLEALDIALNGSNHRVWNITQGQKKTEAFVCPVFLIPKRCIAPSKKQDIEVVSNYFWSDSPNKSTVAISSPEIKAFIEYKNKLKKHMKKHIILFLLALVMILPELSLHLLTVLFVDYSERMITSVIREQMS